MTSNVIQRLDTVMTALYVEVANVPNDPIATAISSTFLKLESFTTNNHADVLRKLAEIIELLEDSITFLNAHEELPAHYVLYLNSLANFLSSVPLSLPCGSFSQNFQLGQVQKFNELKFMFRNDNNEVNPSAIYNEIAAFSLEASKMIAESSLPEDLAKYLETLLFQLVVSSNAYKHRGKRGLDEAINSFIGSLGRSVYRNPDYAPIITKLIVGVMKIAEYSVLISDVSQLPKVIMQALSGGEHQ